MAMTRIQDLWRDSRLPIEDGVYFADGRSYAVEIVGSALRTLDEIDLATEWLTAIDITRHSPAPTGFVCAGEGSHGSEGFFARLDADKRLVWVCYLSESNPFRELTVIGHELTAVSTSGLTITVDLNDPV
jgi:hypothetical protein